MAYFKRRVVQSRNQKEVAVKIFLQKNAKFTKMQVQVEHTSLVRKKTEVAEVRADLIENFVSHSDKKRC